MSNNFSKNIDKKICDCITLDKARIGATYVITACNLPAKLQTRFAELGFIAETKVTVVKAAPLGDPLELTIMGYRVCARAEDLKHFDARSADE